VALNLHGFYAGIEQIFEDIAKSVEVSVPPGSDWHRDLLVQMTTDFPSTRPVLSAKILAGVWKNTVVFDISSGMSIHFTYGHQGCKNLLMGLNHV